MNRALAGRAALPVGLGCMNLSHAYGAPPPRADGLALIRRALDLGVAHLDTAALYGFGANEELVGEAIAGRRAGVFLASKCGMTGVGGKRVIDGRPETLTRTCEESLARLRTDFIELYYLHRWDRRVPIEDSVGALAELARAGKIGAIGLSEVSAATLRKAHAVHPIAAVQSEYSLFTRNPEAGVFGACRELGIAFVAFSPLARGLLTDAPPDPAAFAAKDIRRNMPRFNAPHIARNLALAHEARALAREARCTLSQLALAWLLHAGEFVHAIPGTTSPAHLEENIAAAAVSIAPELLARAGALINAETVSGPRYPPEVQREIDTEELAPG